MEQEEEEAESMLVDDRDDDRSSSSSSSSSSEDEDYVYIDPPVERADGDTDVDSGKFYNNMYRYRTVK